MTTILRYASAFFPLRRGVNISHWLSQSTARGEERRRKFTRDDVRRLAELGFDHLRLPVDEVQLWDEEGRREPEAWDLLNEALDECRACGLRAIVDLHILRSHHFNAGPDGRRLFSDETAVSRFVDCWLDLSRELRSRPVDQVAYELLNEPVADRSSDWNRVLRAPYGRLRQEEPLRVIAIGSNRWNSVSTFPEFEPPTGDPRILLVFHYYSPLLITHYRAPWVPPLMGYEGPIRYPGRPIPDDVWQRLPPELQNTLRTWNEPFDRDGMQRELAPALQKAVQWGLPLWCNEFGVYEKAPAEVRRAWLRDVREVLESLGIPWTVWDFRGAFGLFDRNGAPTVVLEALMTSG